ncbi:MAG: hypothetical protein GWP14_08195 [Actinobacteria bacterium]|nr:hypothetical protein [Actinomycetota bacterium]
MQLTCRLILVLLLISPVTAQAQTLAELRTSPTKLTSQQEELISTWLAQRVPLMADRADLSQAIQSRSDIIAQADKATPAFLSAYASNLNDILKAELRRQKDNDLFAFNAVLCLAQLQQPSTIPLLEQLLEYKSAAVRYWAIKGLAGLLSSSADKAEAARIIQALSTAGTKESSGVVLGLIYARLGSADPEPCLTGLLKIMDARLKAYQSAKVLGPQAELHAIATAAQVWPQLKQDRQNDLAERIGKLMAFSALRYVRDYDELPPNLRSNLARIVVSSESLLVSIAQARKVKVGTPLSQALQSKRADRLARISTALDAWAGTAGSKKFHLQTFNAKPVALLK